jgi:hypothetical protein
LLQRSESLDGLANLVDSLRTFRHQSRDRLVMAGDDYFLAFGDSVEETAEMGFGFKSSDFCHCDRLAKLTSR